MESLEDRQRRLAAMREQAAASQTDHLSPSPSRFLRSNPLEDVSTPASEGSARFDFYTDPLAGFSGPKRRRPGAGAGLGPIHPQPPPQLTYAESGPFPPPPMPYHQQRPNSPRFSASAGPPSWQPVPYQPSGGPDPLPPPQFFQHTPPPQNVNNQFFNHSPGQHSGRGHSRGFFGGRDHGRQSPRYGYGRGHHPPSSSPGEGRGNGFRNGGLSPGGGGRGSSWAGRPQGGNSFREGNRGEGRGSNQGTGQRGRGHASASAKEEPHLFYKKSMSEDPWRGLEATGGGGM